MSWSRIGDRGCWCMLGESVCKTFQSSILGTKYQPARCAWGCRSRLRVSTCDLCPWRGCVVITSYGLTNMDTQRRTTYTLVFFDIWGYDHFPKSDYGCNMIQPSSGVMSSDLLLSWFHKSWALKGYFEIPWGCSRLCVKFSCSECLDTLKIIHGWLEKVQASLL